MVRTFTAAALMTLMALLWGCAGQVDWGPANNWAVEGDGDSDSDSDADGDSTERPILPGGEDHPTGMPSCFDAEVPGESGGGSEPGDGADAGEVCEITEECRSPLICLEGTCVGPGEEGAWCDGIDIACPYDGSTCVGGWCVFTDGACAQNADCPTGYLCQDGACVPAEGDCYTDAECPDGAMCDFGVCVDVTDCAINWDLRGEWSAISVLRLGEATGGFLQAMEWIRNLILGEGHIPDTLALFDDIVMQVLNTYLVEWEREVIVALGDINDLLDDVRIAHTITLDAECRELYRGTITFDHIELEFRGETRSERPEDIPYVGPIPPSEFGARLRCHSIAIDEFRVNHIMEGLLRWLADGITQSASRGAYSTIEEAMASVIDCRRIADAILGSHPTLGLGFEIACDIALSTAIAAITDALDNPVERTLMRLSGEAEVADENRLLDGNWMGSFNIGDFTGEFTATRTR